MIWIITDVIAEAIYRVVYIPAITITAAWCLWCSLVTGMRQGWSAVKMLG